MHEGHFVEDVSYERAAVARAEVVVGDCFVVIHLCTGVYVYT